MEEDVDELFELVETEQAESDAVVAALAKLELIADRGDVEVAEGIAEIFAFSDAHRAPGKAYFWYQVALASRGYSTEFNNLHDTIDQYCGPVGDFRNESQVNELIGELGEFKIRQLDRQASDWLLKHRGG